MPDSFAFVMSDSFAFDTGWLYSSDNDDTEDELKFPSTCVASGDVLSGSTCMKDFYVIDTALLFWWILFYILADTHREKLCFTQFS